MISFEIEDCPNGQNVTNDQFQAIYAIALQDWSRSYVVTEAQETGGDYFLIVEKLQDGDTVTETYFRVEFDGDWGVLFEYRPLPSYPEHEKLATVATEVQAVLEFISEGLDRDREPIPDELVYAHWGVDYEKIIEERKQMLATYQTEEQP